MFPSAVIFLGVFDGGVEHYLSNTIQTSRSVKQNWLVLFSSTVLSTYLNTQVPWGHSYGWSKEQSDGPGQGYQDSGTYLAGLWIDRRIPSLIA